MTPEVAKIVGQKNQPKELNDLYEKIRGLLALSRQEMSKYYDQWDYFDQVYRGERKVDLKDLKARARGEPEKLIIPLTYSQVETFVSFGYSTYNQRDTYYSVIPSGVEDEKPAKVAEALLERDLNYCKYKATKLRQRLTDIARFGLGITKIGWVDEKVPVVTQQPDAEEQAGEYGDLPDAPAPKMKTQVDYVTKFQGNKITSVSPYRWFPDVRLPITRWSEGEFAADEQEESRGHMEELEKDGLVAGLEHVSELPDTGFENRRMTFMTKGSAQNPTAVSESKRYYLLTEVQIKLNPSTTMVDKNTPLMKECDCEQVYIVWLLNDNRIVRISEAGYNHEELGYAVAQFFDDQNRFVNLSLCEVLSALQDTATWFLNSRITSVRKSIFNQIVADPSGIEIDDIIARSPVIRLKSGRGGSGVDTWIKQLAVTDTTQGHLQDVAALSGFAKEASGINENLLGQFSPGRRSAKEASNVANYAASRLMLILACIWESSEAPQGKQMISNARQGLTEETLVRVYGQQNMAEDPGLAAALVPSLAPEPLAQPGQPSGIYQMQAVTKEALIGSYDFDFFNGTLPSTRQAQANVLIEFLQTAMKDPKMLVALGLDPQPMVYEALELLGIRNVQRFKLTPQRLQQYLAMAGLAGNPGGVGVAGGGVPGAGAPPNAGNPVPGPRPVGR